MGKLKDWRILLLFSMVAAYSLLLMTMVNDYYELPSEGFSKEVALRDYEKPNTYQAYDDKSFTTGQVDDGFFLLVNDGQELIFERYTPYGKVLSSHTIEDNIATVLDISAKLVGEEVHYIYHTEEGLFAGSVNLEDGRLQDHFVINTHVQQVILHGKEAVYSVEDQYFYYHESEQALFRDENIKQFDFKSLEDSVFVTTISREIGPFYTSFYEVDFQAGTVKQFHIRDYITSNATKDADHQLYYGDNSFRSMSIFRDSRTNNTYYKELVFSRAAPQNAVFSKFEANDLPNFTYKNIEGDTVTTIMEKFTFVSKDEVASANNTYRNLVEVTDVNGQKTFKRLTKMKKGHPIYESFELMDASYLIFNTIEQENGQSRGMIYMATSVPEIVETSNTLNGEHFMELIYGALTVLPAALAIGFIPSMGFLFPVILFVMPLSLIKITWTERHPEKLLKASIGAYIVSVLYGFYESALKIVHKTQVMSGSLPWHLQSISRMYMMLMVVFAVSFLAYRWYYSKKPEVSFMLHFGVFALTNSILFIMLFYAYSLLAN